MEFCEDLRIFVLKMIGKATPYVHTGALFVFKAFGNSGVLYTLAFSRGGGRVAITPLQQEWVCRKGCEFGEVRPKSL